jgi:hypothetical protein
MKWNYLTSILTYHLSLVGHNGSTPLLVPRVVIGDEGDVAIIV